MKFITVIILIFFIRIISAQNGNVKTYYASGKVESRTSYVKDVLEGISYKYYENGNLKLAINYSNGKLSGVTKSYYPSGLIKEEIQYRDGMLDGVYKLYYENGGLKEVRTYNKGELINSRDLEFDKNYIAPLSAYSEGKNNIKNNAEDFICELDICPEPANGIEEIESKIVYPVLARQYKLEGSVLITARINQRGIPENIRVIKGLGLGCSEAAIEAVKQTKFIPGKHNGEIKETDITFKLNFRIKEAEDKPSLFDTNINEVIISEKENESKYFINCEIDECPRPIGGITELLKNLRYPPYAKRNNISGEVKLKVKVDDLGFVISTEVIEGIGYGCEEAAQSAVIKTQFEPGKLNGKNVESNIEITVPFILEN